MGVRWVFGVAVLAVSLCGLAMGQSTDSFSQNKNKRGDTAPRDDAKRGTADEWKTVKTIFKSAEKFPFISQNARTKAIAGSIPLPTKTPMTVDAKATKLGIDFNGDGRSDAWAKGMKALQPLVLSYPDGSKARYAIYLTHRGAKWSFRYGGYRIGSFKGTRISLLRRATRLPINSEKEYPRRGPTFRLYPGKKGRNQEGPPRLYSRPSLPREARPTPRKPRTDQRPSRS